MLCALFGAVEPSPGADAAPDQPPVGNEGPVSPNEAASTVQEVPDATGQAVEPQAQSENPKRCQVTLCQPLVESAADPGQLDCIPNESAPANVNPNEKEPRRPWRGGWLAGLPIITKFAPDPCDPCDSCDGPTRVVRLKATETVMWIPGHLARVRTLQKVRACADTCSRFSLSPWPSDVVPPLTDRCIADVTLVAKILVDHARYAIPVYRQRQMMLDTQVDVPYSSMLRWRAMGSSFLLPLHQAMHRWAQGRPYVQIDDTGLMALTNGDTTQAKHTIAGHMWCMTDNATFVYCAYATDWKASFLEELLGNFVGILLGDGYAGYNRYREEHPIEGLAGCNDHARRKFCDASLLHDPIANEVVSELSKVFAVERKAKQDGLVGEALLEIRQREAKPVFERVYRLVVELRGNPAVSTALHRAITYFFNQYERLTLYLSNAALQIGNNDLERLIRKIAMMRKASLFAGSAESAKLIAVNFSIILSCEVCKICPYEYLCDVLPKLAGTKFPASRIDELLPHRWAATRKAAKAVA